MLYIVYTSYKPNQAPTNRVLAILKGLDEQGVKARFVLLYPSSGSDRVRVDMFKNIDVEYLWDKRKCRNKTLKFLASFIDTHRFAKSLRRGDTVILFGCSAYVSFFTSLQGVHVYQERTEHPQINPSELPFLQKRYLKSIPKLDGMFVISEGLKQVMEEYGAKNVHVINMLVDSTRFEDLHKKTNEKYIAYCGTASNNKDGVDKLIKAFAILVESHPEIKLKIMGKAPSKDDASGNLKLVEDLGIKERVDFTGIVKAEDMPQMLKNATIVALARPDSLQARCGFPTKLGEYLLSENPVVVTKVGDIPLFLKDGETALMVEPEDINGFADKLIWAIDNPEQAAEIGIQGSHVALSEFNYRRESEKMLNIVFNRNEQK